MKNIASVDVAEIEVTPECGDVAAVLSRIAEAIAGAKHGWDYEEMSPEDAFNAATGAVSTAISEVVDELRLKGSLAE